MCKLAIPVLRKVSPISLKILQLEGSPHNTWWCGPHRCGVLGVSSKDSIKAATEVERAIICIMCSDCNHKQPRPAVAPHLGRSALYANVISTKWMKQMSQNTDLASFCAYKPI